MVGHKEFAFDTNPLLLIPTLPCFFSYGSLLIAHRCAK